MNSFCRAGVFAVPNASVAMLTLAWRELACWCSVFLQEAANARLVECLHACLCILLLEQSAESQAIGLCSTQRRPACNRVNPKPVEHASSQCPFQTLIKCTLCAAAEHCFSTGAFLIQPHHHQQRGASSVLQGRRRCALGTFPCTLRLPGPCSSVPSGFRWID